MMMDGFLAVTDVLEPQRLFLPAAVPGSASPPPTSVAAGDVLLPAEVKNTSVRREKLHGLLFAEQNFSDKFLQAQSLKGSLLSSQREMCNWRSLRTNYPNWFYKTVSNMFFLMFVEVFLL